jgi:hypothetical protein
MDYYEDSEYAIAAGILALERGDIPAAKQAALDALARNPDDRAAADLLARCAGLSPTPSSSIGAPPGNPYRILSQKAEVKLGLATGVFLTLVGIWLTWEPASHAIATGLFTRVRMQFAYPLSPDIHRVVPFFDLAFVCLPCLVVGIGLTITAWRDLRKSRRTYHQ